MLDQRSEGALALTRADTTEATAATLGVTPRTVTAWRVGDRVPSHAHRERIRVAYAIDPRAWDRKPLTPATPDAAEGDGAEGATGAPATASGSAVADRLRTQLARLDAMRAEPDLTAAQRLDLERAETTASRVLSSHERARLSHAEILASEAWADIKAAVMRVVARPGRWIVAAELGGELAALEENASEATAGREDIEQVRQAHAREVAALEAAEAALGSAMAEARDRSP